jgi:enoyl-CoA hydratase
MPETTSETMPETLSVESADFVTTVTLLRPTMTPAFFRECGEVFRHIGRDPDVRAVVLRSSAKAFTYGLDLAAAFADLGPTLTGGGMAAQRTNLLHLIRQLQESFTAIAECPVPVIAAVHHWCIGGGIDLISACDVRVCSQDARFSVRETKIAIVADLGTLQRLPLVVGKGAARELCFTGKDIDADRALQIGLVNHVATDRDAALAYAKEMAAEIAANPPLTVRGVKAVMDYGEGKSVADGLEYVAAWNSAFLASEDLGEAIAAFAGKRTPNFKGR